MQFVIAEDAMMTKPLEETASIRVEEMHESRSDSDLSRASNDIKMNCLESSVNITIKRPIAIDRLSRKSDKKPADSSFEKFDNQIFVNSQQDEKVNSVEVLRLKKLNSGLRPLR